MIAAQSSQNKSIPNSHRIQISTSEAFHHRINHESRRTKISGLGFILFTLSTKTTRRGAHSVIRLPHHIHRLSMSLRRTDLIGWHVPEEEIGVLFTDIAPNQRPYCNSFFREKLRVAGLGFEYEIKQYNSWNLDQPKTAYGDIDYSRPLTPAEFADRLRAEHRRYLRDGVGYVMASLENSKDKYLSGGSDEPQRLPALASTSPSDIAAWSGDEKKVQILLLNQNPNSRVLDQSPSTEEKSPICSAGQPEAVTFQCYPSSGWRNELKCLRQVYEEQRLLDRSQTWQLCLKRIIDVAGSATGLVVLSPLMLLLAIGVKVSSPGPVLFRQKRVGRYGEEFTFLKFRSMKHGNDSSVHEKFVAELMALKVATESDGSAPKENPVYKMVNDSRITRFGAFIRKTSLDELPQLINVLLGQMSLVGPRPPIAYEVDRYAPWHLERLVVAKPGITGLWQVEGRSRVSFDEMVRMDLRYARVWNVWFDIKLLFRTIGVVLKMTGAR